MILYHITSTYHLLCAMVLSKKQKDETIALCSEWLREKFPHMEELEYFFDKIIFADFNYRFFHTDEETEHYFVELIGEPEQYSEIFVWGAHYSFVIYLNYRKIPYSYCEDAAGMISRPDIIRNIDKNDLIKSRFLELFDAYGAYDGSGINVIKKLCSITAQTVGFKADERTVDFNIVSELQALSTEDRNQIISFFNPPCNLHLEKHTTILLTQHFANLGITSFDGQILLYQTVIDYFFGDHTLVIKPHPDDLLYYGQLFPQAKIIRERFPSEFMPFIFNQQPECVATVSSTAIYNLRGHYSKVFELDSRYERDYPMTHRYYAALRIAQMLSLDVACLGANELLVQHLSEILEMNPPKTISLGPDNIPHLMLVDDVTILGEKGRADVLERLINLDENSCAVMINSQRDYCWYNYNHRDLWQNIVPLVLKKTFLSPKYDDFSASTDEEIIFIFSKNKELLKMAKEVSIEKTLPHVGIKVSSMSLDEQMEKIKMLEGILAATEQRLQYYIEKEKGEK